MGGKMLFILKSAVFTLLALLCVLYVNKLFIPKFYYNEDWPTTNTYKDFYNLQPNSLDAIFFGSSHAVSAFNPQVIYDNYKIRTYNMGCEQQSILTTYYWLREALKYQSPKVIIIDTYTFHTYFDNYKQNGLNCTEGAMRKSIDPMRFSKLKVEAAMNIEKLDPNQSALSYIFTNIRYHSRWTDLGENDYIEKEMIGQGGTKGYTTLGYVEEGAIDITFKDEDSIIVEPEPMIGIANEYLGKIEDLCNENGIDIIFTNIPCHERIERYKSTKDYANAHNIPYYDFNEEKLYKIINYNAAEDYYGHPNYKGAEKISRYIGQILSQNYNLIGEEDLSYNLSRETYYHKVKNIELKNIYAVNDYLKRINDDDYTVFFMIPVNGNNFLDDEMLSLWNKLGFETDLRALKEGEHYFGMKSDIILETVVDSDITDSGSTNSGDVIYTYSFDTSAITPDFYRFSLIINNIECCNKSEGINIAVYDNKYKQIIDKVNINTTIEEKYITRY